MAGKRGMKFRDVEGDMSLGHRVLSPKKPSRTEEFSTQGSTSLAFARIVGRRCIATRDPLAVVLTSSLVLGEGAMVALRDRATSFSSIVPSKWSTTGKKVENSHHRRQVDQGDHSSYR